MVSHLIVVPPGVQPVDALQSSNMMEGRRAADPSSSSGFDDYGGIDPTMDPELAMAIRVSTEEARAREEARVSSYALTKISNTRRRELPVRHLRPSRPQLTRRMRRYCFSELWLSPCRM